MIVYIDNILIFSKEDENHVKHVIKVLKILQDTNLRVKIKKSEFHKRELKFLRYNIKPG